MDLLLVDPPYSSLKGVPTDCGYNIGLTSLAAYLREHDIDTGILMGDLLADLPSGDGWLNSDLRDYAERQVAYSRIVNDDTHTVWRRLADLVRQYKPRAVGIAYLTPLKCSVEKVARLVKGIDPGIWVIAGSAHPTFCPEETLQSRDIDFVIRGEGEVPLLGLMREIEKENPRWEHVPGLCYRGKNGEIQVNKDSEMIKDLDTLPLPARDLVLNCDYGSYPGHSISTTRGCPYTCAFCADKSFWNGRVRRRSVGSVVQELALLKETYNAEVVNIQDGTFTFDRRYVEAFCHALIDHKSGVKWGCTARYDNLDGALLDLMKKAGCHGLYFGLESGSDRILKAIDKRTSVEQIIEVSKIAHGNGITCVTSVMLGLPDETREDVEATLKLMEKLETDIFDVNSYVPLPGSRLYGAMTHEEKRRLDWGKLGYKSLDNYFSNHLSVEDLQRYLLKAYEIADAARQRTLLRYRALAGA